MFNFFIVRFDIIISFMKLFEESSIIIGKNKILKKKLAKNLFCSTFIYLGNFLFIKIDIILQIHFIE